MDENNRQTTSKGRPDLWIAIALSVLFPLTGILLATGNDTVGFIFASLMFVLVMVLLMSAGRGRPRRETGH